MSRVLDSAREAANYDRMSSRREAMNWDTVKGDWKQFQGKVKEQWGKLTDDDLDRIEGRREQLAGAIQKRYGIEKDEAEKQVSAFEQHCVECHEEGQGMKSEPRVRAMPEKQPAGQHAMNNPSKEKSDTKPMRHDSPTGGERMKDKEMTGDKNREGKQQAGGQKQHMQTPRAKQ
jgi:uncharacterized protein YjbJ (UPF0337 family)